MDCIVATPHFRPVTLFCSLEAGSFRVSCVECKPVVSTPAKGTPNGAQSEHAEQAIERVSLRRLELNGGTAGACVAHPENVR
jgi:hypothetical protein